MTSISEDQTLPLGLENTLNQLEYSNTDSLATANDVSTTSDVSEHRFPQRSVSPVTLSSGTGARLSPQRSRLMRDQEMQLSELKKDNFGLKLRIYHLEEALRKQQGNDSDDWRLNVDLNVEIDSLKKELQEKSELLLKAKHAMDGLSMQHEAHVKKLTKEFGSRLGEERKKLQDALDKKDREISDLDMRCQQQEQTETELAELRGELDRAYAALHDKEAAVQAVKETQSETEPLRREVERLKDQLNEADKEIEALQGEVKDKEEELKGCHGNIAGKDRELDRLNRDIQRLRSQLERTQGDVDEREARVQELQGDVDGLQQQVKSLRKEAAECQPLRSALKKKDKEIDVLQDTLKDLEKELDSARKELTELAEGNRNDRDQLARELSEALDDNDRLRDQVQYLQDRLDSVGPEIAKYEDTLSKAKQAMKDKEKKVDSLDRELMKMSADKAAECAVLKKTIDDLNDVVHDQEELIKDLNGRVRDLEEELKKQRVKKGRVDGHSATFNWPHDQWADGDSGIEELQAEVLGLKKKLKKKDVELAKLRNALEERDGRQQSPEIKATSVGSQTPPLVQGTHTMADLEAILAELRNLLEQLGRRTQGDTTNYFNLSRNPQDQGDMLERLLTVLAAQQKEPHITLQPSPVHVNVTVPSSQAPSIITVPSVGEVSPQAQRRVLEESSQTRIGDGAGNNRSERSDEAVSALQERVDQLQKDLESRDDEVEALRKALRNIERKLREREGERAKLNDHLTRLKSESSERDSAAESLHNAIGELERKLEDKVGELAQATEEMAGLRRELSDRDQLVRSLRDSVSALDRELKDSKLGRQKEVDGLKEAVATKDASVGSLQNTVESLCHQLAEKTDRSEEVRTLQTALKSKEAQAQRDAYERERLNAMLTGVRDEVEGRDQALQAMQDSLGRLEEELREKEAEKQRLVREIAGLKERIAQLEKNHRVAHKSRKTRGTSPSQPLLTNSTEEDSDLSGIYSQLRELEAENRSLRDKLQEEDDLAEESQIEHVSDMDVLQSKLAEAQGEIVRLKDLVRRSQTPDSRAATPFGGVPSELVSRGVQTIPTKIAHKAVLVKLSDTSATESLQRPALLRENTDGLTLPVKSVGVQHVSQHTHRHAPSSPPSTPPGPLDSSWASTVSNDDGVLGSHKDTDHLPVNHDDSSRLLPDLSALDDQYQESLRLNKLAQHRIAQQLAGKKQLPKKTDKNVGTTQVTSVEASTSPAVVEDLRPVVDELKGRLVKTLKDLEYCKEELAEANSVIGARSSEVERLHKLEDKQAALQQQIQKLSKEKSILLKKYKKSKETMATLSDQLNSSEAISSTLSSKVEAKQKEVEDLKEQLKRPPYSSRLSSSAPVLDHVDVSVLNSSTGPHASSFTGRPSEMSFKHPTAYSTPFHPHTTAYSTPFHPHTTAPPDAQEFAYPIRGIPSGLHNHVYLPEKSTVAPEEDHLTADKSVQCTVPLERKVQDDGATHRHSQVVEGYVSPVYMVSRGVQHREKIARSTQHTSHHDVATQSTGTADKSTFGDTSCGLQMGDLSSIGHLDTLQSSSQVLRADKPHLSIYPLSPNSGPRNVTHLSDDDTESVATATTVTSISVCDQPTGRWSSEDQPTVGRVTVDRGTDPVKDGQQVDKMIQTVQAAQKRLTHLLSAPDLNMTDKKFLEELMQCLVQQERELEEGRRLLMNLTSPSMCNASSQMTPVKSVRTGDGQGSKEVYDLSKMYQEFLETRSNILAAKDKLRRFTKKT